MPENIIKVLLVEDNPADAFLLQEALRETGYLKVEVSHVERLDEAFTRLRSNSFHALLLDLSLPDSQGLDTVARAQAEAPHLAIVVLTGNEDEETAVAAVRMGAQDYLLKGDTRGQLLIRAISYAIERKKVQEEREQLIEKLQNALAQVKQLSGLLPICASCKSIRDDRGYWQQLESYLDEHSELTFTHGICPACARKLYPELYNDQEGKPGKGEKGKQGTDNPSERKKERAPR
jgi:DNA-binding NarL/FixJ family response regulator